MLMAFVVLAGCEDPAATPAMPVDPSEGARVGDLAPNVAVMDVHGDTITRDDLLSEGQPYLLYFFATW